MKTKSKNSYYMGLITISIKISYKGLHIIKLRHLHGLLLDL